MNDEQPTIPPAIPPVSRRDNPHFADPKRKQHLAQAFLTQGARYDHLRPGYPPEIVDRIMGAAVQELPPAERQLFQVVDLGAGTGKLSRALAERGALAGRDLHVIAVDPSEDMLRHAGHPRITPRVATAENTGLPAHSADLVTAAQAWHWCNTEAASAEVRRILRPHGLLALVWNTLDVSIDWVHRYSRIAHAGDVQRDGFRPAVGPGLTLLDHHVHRWTDPRSTTDAINLAKTRSYWITAPPARAQKVISNLDWYLHEHLGYAPGSTIELPYRTDLFLYRVA